MNGTVLPPHPRKGLYYRSSESDRRLYFSDNEVVSITPKYSGYVLRASTGAVFNVRSSVPEYVEYEAPRRESVKGDHYFVRS